MINDTFDLGERGKSQQPKKPTSIAVSPPLDTAFLSYRGHIGGVLAVAWSADGKRIASGSFKMVQVWDVVTGATLLTYYGSTHVVNAVTRLPDGTRIASTSYGVYVWQAQ